MPAFPIDSFTTLSLKQPKNRNPDDIIYHRDRFGTDYVFIFLTEELTESHQRS